MSVFAAIVILGASISATPTPSNASDPILRLEQRLTESLVRRDEIAHGALLADDLVHIGFEGQIAGKSEYMSFFEEGDWRYTRYSPSRVAVKVLGPSAVVTGRVDRAILVNGRETVGAFVFTRVWVQTSGHWKVTSSQFTTAK